MNNYSKHFKVFMPGHSFYFDAYGRNENDIRENLRKEYGYKRLPAGTYIEPYNQKDADFIARNNREMIKGTQLCTTDLY